MKRRLLPLSMLALLSCESDTSLVQPEELSAGPQYSILDGAVEGGNPSFRWLPPIVMRSGAIEGEFDASLLPFITVEVCVWDGENCVGDPVASFTADAERRRDRVRIAEREDDDDDDDSDDEDQKDARHYRVAWRTRENRDRNRDYRLRVLVGALEVGHADVKVVQDDDDLEDGGIDRSEFVGVEAGETLPINFRVAVVGTPVLQPGDLCSAFPDAAIATFEDANLEAAVRAALGVGAEEDLTCALLGTLTHLPADNAGIVSLAGIENLTGLTILVLHHNSVSDLSPLSGLTSLTDIDLISNEDIDISPLSGLTSLIPGPKSGPDDPDLDLSNNPDLDDIQPLLDNGGLGDGDIVDLQSTMVECIDVTALRDKGVTVSADPGCD